MKLDRRGSFQTPITHMGKKKISIVEIKMTAAHSAKILPEIFFKNFILKN
jgi:hypothetical protein